MPPRNVPRPSSAPPSTTVRRPSRHEPLRQLGQTPLTRVYLAVHASGSSRELRVLELLRKELARDDELRAIFLDRAAATLGFVHPLLPETHEVVTERGSSGVAREFVHGNTLARVLERLGRQSLALEQQLWILCDVLGALHYLHERAGQAKTGARRDAPSSERGGAARAAVDGAVLHRNVTPDTVLVTYDGRVKLTGAGFAEVIGALERRRGELATDVGYAAPELLLGYPAGPSTDVYAVGVLLWEALAGRRRVFAEERAAIVRQRTSGEEPDVERIARAVPAPLGEICRRALRVSPRHRYESARELEADLVSYLASAGSDRQRCADELSATLHRAFKAELAEMELFIGSRPEPAPITITRRAIAVSPEALKDELEGDWNDPTLAMATTIMAHPPEVSAPPLTPGLDCPLAESPSPAGAADPAGVTAPPAEHEPPSTRRSTAPSEREQPVALASVAPPAPRPSNTPRRSDPDTGGHRAFATHVELHPHARPLSRALTGALAMLGAAALTLWSLPSEPPRPPAEQPEPELAPLPTLRDEATPLAAPSELEALAPPRAALAAPASPAEHVGAGVAHARAGQAELPAPAPPEPAATTPEAVERAPATDSAPSAPAFHARSSVDEDPSQPKPAEPPPAEGLMPSELPLVDEARDELQTALLSSARRARRAALVRRAAMNKERRDATLAAPPDPPAIDDRDPYEE